MASAGEGGDQAEQDLATCRMLVGLWAAENPVKTTKLQFLLLTQAVLVAALVLSGGPAPKAWPLCLVGALVSLVWFFSLGRTVLFQKRWRAGIREIAARHPDDSRFRVLETGNTGDLPLLLRAAGAVPSSYYLVGAPLLFLIGWAVALALILA